MWVKPSSRANRGIEQRIHVIGAERRQEIVGEHRLDEHRAGVGHVREREKSIERRTDRARVAREVQAGKVVAIEESAVGFARQIDDDDRRAAIVLADERGKRSRDRS